MTTKRKNITFAFVKDISEDGSPRTIPRVGKEKDVSEDGSPRAIPIPGALHRRPDMMGFVIRRVDRNEDDMRSLKDVSDGMAFTKVGHVQGMIPRAEDSNAIEDSVATKTTCITSVFVKDVSEDGGPRTIPRVRLRLDFSEDGSPRPIPVPGDL